MKIFVEGESGSCTGDVRGSRVAFVDVVAEDEANIDEVNKEEEEGKDDDDDEEAIIIIVEKESSFGGESSSLPSLPTRGRISSK